MLPNSIVLSTIGVVACFGVSLVSQVTGGGPMEFAQYGAMGLVALMVIQNYKDRIRLVRTLEEKDRRIEALYERTLKAIDGCLARQKQGD